MQNLNQRIMKKIIYNLLLALLLPLSVAAQHTVRGTVTSDGEPLIGASILVVGTTTGTVTDLDGTYEVTATSPNDSLEFSYTGYGSQRIAINGRSVIDVNLAEQALILERGALLEVAAVSARAHELLLA